MSTAKRPEVLSPEAIIEQADADLAEAQAYADDLEARVREDADTDVTHEQVERARGLARFAAMRREASAKKAAALAVEQETARRKALIDKHLPRLQGRDEAIEAELEKAREHVRAALALTRDTNGSVVAVAHLAKSEGNPYEAPEGADEVIGYHGSPHFTWFETRGERHHVVTPLALISQLVDSLGLSGVRVESDRGY